MPFEIERKYLVKEWLLPGKVTGTRIVQAYLSTDPGRTVRIRLAGDQAFLTIKGESSGIKRPEFEYTIPVADAVEMLKLAVSSPVEKVRREIEHDGMKWEVDYFEGVNQGLVLAEIELSSEDYEFTLPEWVGKEVTEDPRYHNSQLSLRPYSEWA